ncbi:HDOD domain-containing protein [Desulfurivibrio alkaliphilus]|uniref:Putative signal transduction protein n=1 Tax=Desulfurivibrio alkaliphilus (strain DSM 19089 / UNIQEM U267 / AHT2) TaxID=589865 RepID=D6Z6U0_DESAT|nr:HDOD domain-containing protein [Desulfurivibrio alkaliphilus]ADH85049.1 putative signal transduction protein [Desulfurivibrio alkaliphilus AHT 2]
MSYSPLTDNSFDHVPVSLSPRDLVRGEITLASLPALYHELNRVVATPGSVAQDAALVIERDPALAARLLALVNSAYYGLVRQVDTIAHAITLVGLEELRTLVLATVVVEKFSGLPNELEDMADFWRQSLVCAVVARGLSLKTGRASVAGRLFTAGLLHRVGDLLIFRRLPELARQALLHHRDNGLPRWEAERRLLGFDYAQVGAELAQWWQFPPELVELLALQQQPEKASICQQHCALLCLAVNAAHGGELPPAAASWQLAEVSPQVLAGILAEADRQVAEIAGVYGISC